MPYGLGSLPLADPLFQLLPLLLPFEKLFPYRRQLAVVVFLNAISILWLLCNDSKHNGRKSTIERAKVIVVDRIRANTFKEITDSKITMALRVIDRLKCFSSVELQRNVDANVFLVIDFKKKAAWIGSADETEISHSRNRFLVSESYVFHYGARYRLSSGFHNKCKRGVTNALRHMGASHIAQESKSDLLSYVYNMSKRAMSLPLKEIVIHAEIEIVTIFQFRSTTFHGGINIRQPRPYVSSNILTRLDESIIFTGDMTLMPLQPLGMHHIPTQSFQSGTSNGDVIVMPSQDGSTSQLDGSQNLDDVVEEPVLLAEERGPTTIPSSTEELEITVPVEEPETVIFLREEEIMGDLDTCSICLDSLVDVNDGMALRCMPCMHVFHEDCILTWLEDNNSCPLCRFTL